MSHTLLQSRRPSLTVANRLQPMIDDRKSSISTEQFQETLPRYLPRMLAVARRHLACEADCADAVQDACVRALTGLPRFRGECDLGTWLHRIVVNVCLMKQRSLAVRRSTTLTGSEEIVTTAEEHHRWSDEVRRGVREAVHRLPQVQQLVVQLRYFEGFNTAETAALLGVRPEVVKTRLHRACRALRRLIADSIASEA
jgi:RNA polymerase sigma-70 factor, ECF subfamily